MPEINGLKLLEYIRPFQIPVIFLTARASVEDRIRGLKLGADDYITKPFQIGELSSRVEAVLRRSGSSNRVLVFEYVVIHPDSRTVTKDGVPVEITMKEFHLLVEAVSDQGRGIPKANIARITEAFYMVDKSR